MVLVSFLQMWVVSFLPLYVYLELSVSARPRFPHCCIKRYRVVEKEPEDLQI